jgi:hypothetical protein
MQGQKAPEKGKTHGRKIPPVSTALQKRRMSCLWDRLVASGPWSRKGKMVIVQMGRHRDNLVGVNYLYCCKTSSDISSIVSSIFGSWLNILRKIS